jgi:hypothetical protein
MRIKPYVSPLFDVTGNARHRPLADQHPPLLRASKLTDAAQWRVDIKGICGHTLADPARILVEQIRSDDPEAGGDQTSDQKGPAVVTTTADHPHHGRAAALKRVNRAGSASQLIIAEPRPRSSGWI